MKSPPIHWATRWASINAVNAGCLGGGGGGGYEISAYTLGHQVGFN